MSRKETVQKFFSLIQKPVFPSILVYTFISLYTVGGILLNLHRFWQFELGYYDFGIFNRAIWLASRFQAPIIDHFIVPGKWIFADHFNPSIFILTPVFWITDKSEALLIFPSIFVGLSAVVIYKIARLKLKNLYVSAVIPFVYLMSIGMQNAVYYDFHELTLAALPITLCYYFILTKRLRLFLLTFIFTLGFKESLFIFGIGTSIFLYLFQPSWRKIALITLMISIVWGYLSTQVIIPYFSGQPYYYAQKDSFVADDSFLAQLVTPSVKPQTVLYTFANYIFLPLGYLPLLPTVFMNLASRFLTPGSTRWDLGLHYNAEIAPALALGTVLTLRMIQKKVSSKVMYGVCILLIVNALFFHRILFKGPMGLSYHPAFYANTENHTFLKELVSHIPPDTTVAAQNNLASHLMHQKEIWILRENYFTHKPEYIVFDAREGQLPGGQLGISHAEKLFAQIAADTQYELFFQSGDQYIYKRVAIQ